MKKTEYCLLAIVLIILFLFLSPILSSAQSCDPRTSESYNPNLRESGPRQDILDPYQEDGGELFLDEDGDGWNVEYIGSLGCWDEAQSVVTSGNYAYVASMQTGLRILDISEPTNPVEVGNYDTDGLAKDVAVSGDYAYVADGENGLVVIDITDPTNPFEVGSYSHTIFSDPCDIRGIAISGDNAYVVYKRNYTWVDCGLLKIDVSDPTNPVVMNARGTENRAYSLCLSGDFVYIADGAGGMRIIDISNFNEVGHFNTDGYARAIAVSGDYAYVGDANVGLQIVNISDPTSPTLEASFSTERKEYFDLEIFENYICIANYAYGLRIVDIADPTNPVEISSLPFSEWPYKISVHEQHVYLANSAHGLQVFDITNIETISNVGSYDTSGGGHSVDISSDLACVMDTDGMHIINISNPSFPEKVGFVDTGYRGYVAVSGDYSYVVNGNGLTVIDISNPSNPVQVFVNDAWATWGRIFISEDYAYVAMGWTGIKIIDISNPANPVEIGSYNYGGIVADVKTFDDYAYLAVSSEQNGLLILDISDPTSPFNAGYCTTIQEAECLDISGNHAYVVNDESEIFIIDISSPTDPSSVSIINEIEGIEDIYISGNNAYLTVGQNGLKVVNIADHTNLYEIGSYDTHGIASEIVLSGDFAYVADGYDFVILDCSQVIENPAPLPFDLNTPLNNTTVGCNDVELRWTESSDDVSEYVVWYAMDSEFSVGVDSVVMETNTATLGNLEDQSTYWWKVRANNETSTGTWSNQIWSFNTDISLSVDDGLNSDFPTEFAITNAYPNPFNPTLNVSISIPESSDLKVSVYNIMGQEVATLSNGGQYSAGIHNFVFNANEVTSHGSGVYFVHASVPGKLNQVKKVVLMK